MILRKSEIQGAVMLAVAMVAQGERIIRERAEPVQHSFPPKKLGKRGMRRQRAKARAQMLREKMKS